MFARYFVELALPAEEVADVLVRDPQGWIPRLARAAEERGEQLLADVGFGAGGRRVGRQVEIELGRPVRFPTRTSLPMVWRATSVRALFPSLEADLEVAALGPRHTQLSISARYRPPMGAFGRAIDRALLHLVAEATVKDFLDRAAESLAAECTAPAG